MSLASQVTLLAQRIGAEFKALRGDTGWTTPTLGNSFAHFGGAYGNVMYRKTGLNFTHLQGLLTLPGTASSTAVPFTLPSGYRPGKQLLFLVLLNSGGSAALSIDAAGNLTFPGIASNQTGYVSLSGVSFYTGA